MELEGKQTPQPPPQRGKTEAPSLYRGYRLQEPRGLEKSVILSLASCNWIRNHQNLLISGPTGVGKTFLACAFAQRACREGFRTFYIRFPQFFYQIALARADGSYVTLMKRLSKTHLLAIDDLGLAPLRMQREEICSKSLKTVMDPVPP